MKVGEKLKTVSIENCLKVFFCKGAQIKEVVARGKVGVGEV